MKKQLVEKNGIEACICKATGKVYADGSFLLTPGARDELSRRGIAIVNGPRPEAAPCLSGCTCEVCTPQSENGNAGCTADLELLLLGVAALLKTEYGVHDQEMLKAISCQVVKTIRENL